MKVDRAALRMSEEEIDAFLGAHRWARVGTVSAAGDPHVSPVGYLWHEGRVYLYSADFSPRTRNIEHSPKVSICVDDGVGEDDGYLDRRGVIVSGTATILDRDDPRIEEIRPLYTEAVLGDSTFLVGRRTHVWIEVTPTRFASWDFSRIPPAADRLA